MKKYMSILASAGLLAACEQKTETVTPAASPSETAPSEATTTTPATESPTTESTTAPTSPPSP